MPQIYPVTQVQANQLDGQEFSPDSFFHPTQDGSSQWFISPEEWLLANKTLWPFLIGIIPIEYVEPINPNPKP